MAIKLNNSFDVDVKLDIVTQVISAAHVPVYSLFMFPMLAHVVLSSLEILYVLLDLLTVKNQL